MIQITIKISNRCIEPSDRNNITLAIGSQLNQIVPYPIDLIEKTQTKTNINFDVTMQGSDKRDLVDV